MSEAFAMRRADGTWAPCDDELNAWLDRIAAARGGQPFTIIAFTEDGEAEVIAGAAYHVLHLALMAMDARLRPERGYRERADEIYAVLAGGLKDGIQELRRVFNLGAKGPWLEP
jgi:hypothetical protein